MAGKVVLCGKLCGFSGEDLTRTVIRITTLKISEALHDVSNAK